MYIIHYIDINGAKRILIMGKKLISYMQDTPVVIQKDKMFYVSNEIAFPM